MLTDDEIAWDAAPHLAGADWQRCDEHERACYRDAIREVLAALHAAGLVLEQGWRFDMENAPVDEALILATTGEHVGEAIRDIENDDGSWSFRWARSDTPLHPNLRPIAWRPLPAPPTDSKEPVP